jgi:aryl-alcohol dehydrogenase-like predicted oxidoreductase
MTDDCFDVVEDLETYASDHGHTLLELSLSWLACQPLVSSVIAGAVSPEQVRANAAATTSWQLTQEELSKVGALAPSSRSFAIPVQLKDGPLHRA